MQAESISVETTSRATDVDIVAPAACALWKPQWAACDRVASGLRGGRRGGTQGTLTLGLVALFVRTICANDVLSAYSRVSRSCEAVRRVRRVSVEWNG